MRGDGKGREGSIMVGGKGRGREGRGGERILDFNRSFKTLTNQHAICHDQEKGHALSHQTYSRQHAPKS